MLKASIFGIIGFVLGSGTVEGICWTKTEAGARQVTPAATVGMPLIDERHAKTRSENLPDQTVKEPY
jgi:hypothetical protein